MQRGNAVKALRADASRLEREGRLSAANAMEEGSPTDALIDRNGEPTGEQSRAPRCVPQFEFWPGLHLFRVAKLLIVSWHPLQIVLTIQSMIRCQHNPHIIAVILRAWCDVRALLQHCVQCRPAHTHCCTRVWSPWHSSERHAICMAPTQSAKCGLLDHVARAGRSLTDVQGCAPWFDGAQQGTSSARRER
jgi:hypothetical protein